MASGAVTAEDIPAANKPVAINMPEKGPNIGSSEGAKSAAEEILTCEPKNAVAPVDKIAIDIKVA